MNEIFGRIWSLRSATRYVQETATIINNYTASATGLGITVTSLGVTGTTTRNFLLLYTTTAQIAAITTTTPAIAIPAIAPPDRLDDFVVGTVEVDGSSVCVGNGDDADLMTHGVAGTGVGV